MQYRDVSMHRLSDTMWEIPRTGGMRVPGRIFASAEMMGDILKDEAARQGATRAFPAQDSNRSRS